MSKYATRYKVRRGYFRNQYKELKRQIFIKLGDKCVICGFNDPRALHIDHVNNDGFEERKKIRGATTRLRKVLEDKENRYQLLCANCNFIKKYEQHKIKWGEVSGL